jgi:hypothetical protein
MDLTQYCRNMMEFARRDTKLALPTVIKVKPDQHLSAVGKRNGTLLCMADGVPVIVDSTQATDTPYCEKDNRVLGHTFTYAHDTTPPYNYR